MKPIPFIANVMSPGRVALLATCAALWLGGCAGVTVAQMALPAPLDAQVAEPVHGLGGGRSGRFQLAGSEGQFQRGASRLSVFDGALAMDRFDASYRSDGVQARCRARQTALQIGVLAGAARPLALHCQFSGELPGELALTGEVSGQHRTGNATFGDTRIELRSVHRLHGSPLPLEVPIGYLMLHEGQPVGAIELNGTPRLWRPAAGTPAHAAVTQAALALALLWEPEGR